MRTSSFNTKTRTHQSFVIRVHFDGDEISATVKTIDINRFAVWMNDQYKFSVAAGVNDFEEVEWYVIEKNKYVPYVDQIGNKIETFLA
ncbi:MAG TPA: hypothetical protein VM101_09185 [Flavitalea sp.]|nr:hypothetical protein [Flavitalea sp.]